MSEYVFPHTLDDERFGMAGMTLRDYFAGQALAKLADTYVGQAYDVYGVTKAAYKYADAMMEARK